MPSQMSIRETVTTLRDKLVCTLWHNVNTCHPITPCIKGDIVCLNSFSHLTNHTASPCLHISWCSCLVPNVLFLHKSSYSEQQGEKAESHSLNFSESAESVSSSSPEPHSCTLSLPNYLNVRPLSNPGTPLDSCLLGLWGRTAGKHRPTADIHSV